MKDDDALARLIHARAQSQNLLFQTWAIVPVRASVCVIMNWLDILYPWVTCKWSKIRKNKIILFYSFLIFTFTFSLFVVQKVMYVFFNFSFILLQVPLWSFVFPFKVHRHKPRELLMLLSHTMCDTLTLDQWACGLLQGLATLG